MFYFAIFKSIFLILFSPLFSYLHLKVDAIKSGEKFIFHKATYTKLIVRAIRISLRNLLWQTVYLIPIVLFCSIPLIGWFTPVFIILLECYYYGYAMIDYGLATEKMSKDAAAQFVGNQKGLAIGNGLLFYMMHIVPLIGWMSAPFYSLIAAHFNTQALKTT
jgi:CysZ protein